MISNKKQIRQQNNNRTHDSQQSDPSVCLSFSPSLCGSTIMAMLKKARQGMVANSFSLAPWTHFRGYNGLKFEHRKLFWDTELLKLCVAELWQFKSLSGRQSGRFRTTSRSFSCTSLAAKWDGLCFEFAETFVIFEMMFGVINWVFWVQIPKLFLSPCFEIAGPFSAVLVYWEYSWFSNDFIFTHVLPYGRYNIFTCV